MSIEDYNDGLTGILAEVGDACGLAAALRLAADFGGTEIYVPLKMTAGHKLINSLGRDAAETLAGLYGGDTILIPMGPTTTISRVRAAVREHLAAGVKSATQIARAAGCHTRTVFRHKNPGMKDDSQEELFK